MSIVNLQSDPIYVRSPYNITFQIANILGSKIELFIWNNGDTPPTSPTYTLEKLIPSTTNTTMIYNVSNYVREYIDFVSNSPNNVATPIAEPSGEWAYIKVIRYQLEITGYVELDTKTWYAFDGFGYYQDGYNPDLGEIGLEPGTYEYWYDADNPATGNPQAFLNRATMIRVVPELNYEVVYTSLENGAQSNFTFNPAVIGPVQKFWSVFPSYEEYGNTIEYKNALGTVLATWTFKPISECKYTPVVCDFVNKYGSWQRTIFFKASMTSIETKRDQYNLYLDSIINYDTSERQKRGFNINAKETIKVNTDWVDESYNELILKPLMMSEIVLLDNEPVNILTKKTELFEHMNKKMINYQLEFEYAFDIINNVV